MKKKKQRKKKAPKKKTPIKKKQSDSVLSEGNEEATHSGEDSKLGSTSDSWWKKHKYEVIFGFVVAMLAGVILYGLSWFVEKKTLDKATIQRLQVTGFEAKINLETAEEIKEIIDNKGDVNHVRINVRRLDSTSAVAALKDANLLSILSSEKVILLKSYVDDVQTFNQSLQTYQQTLESEGFKNTNAVNGMRKLVLYNADAVRDKVCLLQEKVNEYFDDKPYDIQKIKKMRERLKDIKAK